jgi:hypothetical protein
MFGSKEGGEVTRVLSVAAALMLLLQCIDNVSISTSYVRTVAILHRGEHNAYASAEEITN